MGFKFISVRSDPLPPLPVAAKPVTTLKARVIGSEG